MDVHHPKEWLFIGFYSYWSMAICLHVSLDISVFFSQDVVRFSLATKNSPWELSRPKASQRKNSTCPSVWIFKITDELVCPKKGIYIYNIYIYTWIYWIYNVQNIKMGLDLKIGYPKNPMVYQHIPMNRNMNWAICILRHPPTSDKPSN